MRLSNESGEVGIPGRAWWGGVALVALLALPLAGCYPMKVSPECQAQISDCLKACPPPLGISPGEPGGLPASTLDDTRSVCQKKCHESCK